MPRWARKNLTRKRVNANEGVKGMTGKCTEES